MPLRPICDCSLSEKALYTSFLLIIGLGLLMAIVYLYTSHQGHDGEPGVSVDDIAFNYYGNRSGARLEAAIRGSMAPYITPEDRYEVVAWLQDGAEEAGYNETIQPILAKTCTAACHKPESGLPIPDLTAYEKVRAVAEVDTGASLHSLMRLSHIHLFGIGLLAFTVGLVFRLVVLRRWLKVTLIVLPFAAMFADIAAWFLTKGDPVYAYVVLTGGGLLMLSLGTQVLLSLWQMWLWRPRTTAASIPR